jgi:hypothetical protein
MDLAVGGGVLSAHMEHCIVFPVVPGKTPTAREFMRELENGRHAEHERSERRVGIAGERWFLARSRDGELLVGMIETDDLRRTMGLLAVSLHPYDLWFKARFREITGTDLNQAPELDAAVLLASSQTAERRGVPAAGPAAI